LLLIGALAASVFGQDFRATLQGQVTDASGSAVPNAIVRAIQIGNNATKEVKSTGDGFYVIPYLEPGTYNVEAYAPGFQTLKRTNIVLRVADKLNLELQLTVGQTTQEVTVSTQQEVLETASADRGLVFDPIKTREYPLNGRQTYMLLSLTPGVILPRSSSAPADSQARADGT
jgi:hypothetical protein